MSYKQRKQNNIFLVVIFALCVLFLIFVSLSIKLIGVLGESSYQSNERFTVLLLDNSKEAIYLSVSEPDKTSSKLVIDEAGGIPDLPIAVDGVIKVSTDIDSTRSVPSLISEIFLKRNEERVGLTFFDLIRMYITSRTFPASEHTTREVKKETDVHTSELMELFSDSNVIKEDKTIAVENAADISGVAGKLESVISTMGGNVISVETSVITQPHSKILYTGDESYTLKKLQKLLGYPLEKTEEAQVSEIFIIIGQDGLGNYVFPNK